MSFDISKIPRMKKAWGMQCPPELEKISRYLSAEGWSGSFASSSAELLVFEKILFDDYLAVCFLNKVYEYPTGVFNFQAQLRVSSRRVGRLANEVFGDKFGVFFDDYEIFSIGLQHLKWNDSRESGNPVWAASSAKCDSNWVDDWERYVKPIVDSLTDEMKVVDFCLGILSYEKKPWVKSDGYGGENFEVTVVLLLLKNNLMDQARAFVSQVVNGGKSRGDTILWHILRKIEGEAV